MILSRTYCHCCSSTSIVHSYPKLCPHCAGSYLSTTSMVLSGEVSYSFRKSGICSVTRLVDVFKNRENSTAKEFEKKSFVQRRLGGRRAVRLRPIKKNRSYDSERTKSVVAGLASVCITSSVNAGLVVSFNYSSKNKREDCVVCIRQFKINDVCTRLECGHYFHNDCIERWLKINNSCPSCRAPHA